MTFSNFNTLFKNISLPLIPMAALLNSGIVYSETEEVIVTGVLSEVAIEDTTSSVTVLDRQAINELNKKQFSDVLRTVPGLIVEEQGGAGGLVNIYLRGGESNFTLVLIDGVPLNDPTNTRGGSFDFSSLSLESVDRIEIVRGPQSAIYGSDALSGVINVITVGSQAGHHQRLSIDAGEYGYLRSSISATGHMDDWGYSVKLSTLDSGDPVDGSQRKSDEANIGLHWSPTEQHHFKVSYRYVDGERASYPEQSGGPLLALSDQLETSNYRDESWLAEWKYHITDSWVSTINVNQYQRDEDFNSPGIVPYFSVPPNSSETEFTRDTVRWVNRLGGQQIWAHVGMDKKREKGRSDGVVDFGFLIPTAFELDRSTTGTFLDLNAQVTEKTLLQSSIRHDDPDDMDSEDSYNLGIRHEFREGWILSANWGQAFKLPSFFALGHSLTGNPFLQPETAESWDITSAWQVGTHNFKFTYFDNHFEHLVTFDEVAFKNVNSLPVDTSGAEFTWVWQPIASSVSAQAGATYTDIDADDNSLRLTGRPEWKAGISVLWRFSPGWSFNTDYRYTGEQYATSQHTGTGTVETLSGYHMLDFSVAWKISPQVTLTSALDNVLDEDFENAVGFPGVRRTARVGILVSL